MNEKVKAVAGEEGNGIESVSVLLITNRWVVLGVLGS